MTTTIPLSVFSIMQRTAVYTVNVMLIERHILSKFEIGYIFMSCYGFL